MIRRPPRSPLFPYPTLSRSLTPHPLLPPVIHLQRQRQPRLPFDLLVLRELPLDPPPRTDRKSTRLNSSHSQISYAVFCLKKKKNLRVPHSAYVQEYDPDKAL